MMNSFLQQQRDLYSTAIKRFSSDFDYSELVKLVSESEPKNPEEKYRNLLITKMLSRVNPDMESLLGHSYYRGICVKKNIQKAKALFNNAEKKGSDRSKFDIALMYYESGDYRRAIEGLTFCLNNKNLFKDEIIGTCYSALGDSYSRISDPQWHKAVENLSIAADKYKLPYACRRLGEIYSNDVSRLKDRRQALNYFETGAELGDRECAYEVAESYICGDTEIGREKDLRKGVALLTPYQNDGDPKILSILGYAYMVGSEEKGLPCDMEKAKNYYEQAWQIQEADSTAAYLGYIYYYLDDYKNAEKMLLYASQHGSVEFSDFLGRIYKNGLTGAPNYRLARKYYDESYRDESINNVFTMSEYVDVLEALGSFNEAYDACEKGVEKFNDIEFEYHRAKLVLEGKVNRIDNEEAAGIMEAVCDFEGYEMKAHQLLGKYYSNNRQYQRAIRHLTAAFENGDAESGVLIGHLYERGDGSLGVDQDKAYSWYSRAAKAGSELAKKEMQCFRTGLFGKYKRYRQL